MVGVEVEAMRLEVTSDMLEREHLAPLRTVRTGDEDPAPKPPQRVDVDATREREQLPRRGRPSRRASSDGTPMPNESCARSVAANQQHHCDGDERPGDPGHRLAGAHRSTR